jgi:hypothetical protein
MRQAGIKTKVMDDLTAIVYKDNWNVNMLNDMHRPLAEGNFCDEHGDALKPAIVQDYNMHMRFLEKCDCVTNTYSISRQIWKLKKCYFSVSWAFQLWTVLSSSSPVVQNYCTNI